MINRFYISLNIDFKYHQSSESENISHRSSGRSATVEHEIIGLISKFGKVLKEFFS